MGADPGLRHEDGRPGAAGAKEYLAAKIRIVARAIEALGRRASQARRDGHRLGRKALAEVATVARPDTIQAWYRKLVARKIDGSKFKNWVGDAAGASFLTLDGPVPVPE
jgi:hypothetical protein